MTLLPLAIRNLWRNRRRTLAVLVAVVVGVGTMVAMQGFLNGVQAQILDGVIGAQVGPIQIHRAGYLHNVQALPLDLDFPDTPDLERTIRAVPGVTGLAPRIVFGGMLSTPDVQDGPDPLTGRSTYLVLTAIDPGAERVVTPKRFAGLFTGRAFTSAEADEVVVDQSLARAMPLGVFPEAARRPDASRWPALISADKDGVMGGANVVVSGTLQDVFWGSELAYVPLRTAQRMLREEGRVTEIGVGVDEVSDIPRVRDALRAALGPQFEVHAWDGVAPFYRDQYDLQGRILDAMALTFLVIIVLGVVNAMLMNVLERVREIGTMLAVGMRRRQIAQLFLLEGQAIGAVGGLAGAVLGAAVVATLHRSGIHLPSRGTAVDSIIYPAVRGAYLARAVVLAAAATALASLWPARKASRLNPVDALRAP